MKTLYKTLKSNLTSEHKDFKWERDKWYKTEGEISLCGNGFHASKRLIDAMSYVAPEEVALVEVKGKHDIKEDKECWEYMRIVKSEKWTKKHSVKLAVYAAELVLNNFEKESPYDKRPRESIEAVKRWLKNPTKENEGAARSASSIAWGAARSAWSAESAARSAESAESAARSAWSAARSAAWSAARSAAWSAAWSAESAVRSAAWSAWSAESAARSAARSAESAKAKEKILDKCETFIREMLKI